MLSFVVDHTLQEFKTLYLMHNLKIATPFQTKTPVRTAFGDWCLRSSFVHETSYSHATSLPPLQYLRTDCIYSYEATFTTIGYITMLHRVHLFG